MPEPRPKRWPVVELGTVSTINERSEDIHVPAGKKLFSIEFQGISAEEGRLVEPVETTRKSPPAKTHFVREGDVLLTQYLTYAGRGRAAVVSGLGGVLAFVAPGIHVIRPSRRLSPKWLWHYLRRPRQTGLMEHSPSALGTGGRVTPQDLKTLPVPLPPLAAQERIVGLLDEADDARRLQRESAAETERALMAAFSEVFGDVESHRDKSILLLDLIERVEKGGVPSTSTLKRPAGEGEYGLLKPTAVTSGRFLPRENLALGTSTKPANLPEVAQGDLLIVWMNTRESVGATALVEDACDGLYLPDTLWRLVPRPGVDVRFIKALLSAPQTRQRMRDLVSGTVARLAQSHLLSLPAFRPPAESQARFADLHRALTKAVGMQDKLGAELDGLLDAMLSRAYARRQPAAARGRMRKAAIKKGSSAPRKRADRSVGAGPPAASEIAAAESRIIWGKLSDFQRDVWAASRTAGQQFRVSDIMRAVKMPADSSADRERFLSALELLVSLGALIKDGRLDADRWRRPDPDSDREVAS